MTMSNCKSGSNNLAIIGASGTGKTTLAVGLYATSTESFTVAPDGDETRKYLEIRKTSIEEGFWPAATNESENFDLRLRLHASGRQTDIVFREYMGERMERDPNYIREVIGTPKSAMILFNPGMPGLSKPETRNRMLGNLKVIAQHLKDNGCIAVAFVVTASDRFTSDLAAFREDFEAYASEVTNHLTNLGLEWKRFEVTVSGQLDDQNKPKLARGENNTTHAPFLWLLKRISDRKRRKSLLTAAAIVATILGVSGAVFGGLVAHSRKALTRAETTFANTTNALNMAYAAHDEAKVRTTAQFFETNRFDKIRTILPSDRERKVELVNRANEQSDLWSVRLLSMELTSNKSRIATKPLDVQLNWFEDFNKRLTASLSDFRDAVIERDMLTNEWAKSSGMLETKCQTAHFRYEVDQERKSLASAKPDVLSTPLQKSKELIADAVTYSLVTNRADLCANLGLMTARTNAIVRYVDSKMRKPEDDNPPEGSTIALRQQISKELKRGLTSQEFDNLPEIIAQRCVAAHKAWENYQFPLRVRKQLDDLKAASDAPADALKNSRAFLESMDELFSSIPEGKRSTVKASITNERAGAIGRYLDVKTPWKPDDDEPPVDTSALQQQVRRELTSALTEAEFETLLGELEKRRTEARKAWDAYHFQTRVRELETALNGAGSNPTIPLKDSMAFLGAMTNTYPTISTVEFINARNTIEDARKKALAAYENLIVGRWDVNGNKPPEYDAGGIRTAILTEEAVTDEEYKSFSSGMKARFVQTQREWNTRQKKLVDDFSVEGDPEKMIRAYEEWFYAHNRNPFLSELVAKVDQALQKYFRAFIGDYYCKDDMSETQRRFNKFRRVCAAFEGNGLVGNPILLTTSGRFATLCNIRGNLNDVSRGIYSVFDQKVRISKIEARVSLRGCSDNYKGLDMAVKIGNLRWDFDQKDFVVVSSRSVIDMKESSNSKGYGRIPKYSNDSWETIWSGSPEEISFGPYTQPFIVASYEDRLNGVISSDVSDSEAYPLDIFSKFSSTQALPDTGIYLYHNVYDNTVGTLQLRVTGQRIGDNYHDLAEESGLIR